MMLHVPLLYHNCNIRKGNENNTSKDYKRVFQSKYIEKSLQTSISSHSKCSTPLSFLGGGGGDGWGGGGEDRLSIHVSVTRQHLQTRLALFQ